MAKYRWFLRHGKLPNEVELRCTINEDPFEWRICKVSPTSDAGHYALYKFTALNPLYWEIDGPDNTIKTAGRRNID